MSRTFRMLPCLALLLTWIPAAASAASFRTLGNLGEPWSTAIAVSGDGSVVVGNADSGDDALSGPFVWDAANGMREVDLPANSTLASASDVSADGSTVIGWTRPRPHGPGFRWTQEEGASLIDPLPGGGGIFPPYATGHAVSADGSVVVGDSTSPIGREAFRLDGSGIQGLGDLPGGSSGSDALGVSADGSVVAGVSGSDLGLEIFLWDAQQGLRGLGLTTTTVGPRSIGFSADGTAIAYATPDSHLAYWDETGGARALAMPTPPTNTGMAFPHDIDISGDGSRVVATFGWITSAGELLSESTLLFWDEERGLIDLEVLLASLGVDLEGWTIERLAEISDDGRAIVGSAYHAGEDRTEAFLAIIPEPSTAVLLGLGLMLGAGRGTDRSRTRPGT